MWITAAYAFGGNAIKLSGKDRLHLGIAALSTTLAIIRLSLTW
jgi:hypothetical protein